MHSATALLLCTLLTLPAVAQQADGGSVETAILDILLERGLITPAEHAELAARAREQDAARAGEVELFDARLARLRAPDVQVTGGAPGKLVFRSPDGTWSLGLKGFVQARAERLDSDDDGKDGTNLSVPRGRLEAFGAAGTPGVTYELEVDLSTTKDLKDPAESRDARLEKAQVDWSFSRWATLRMGQAKVPFGREEHVSSSGLHFPERSIASREFSPGYEPGVLLVGRLLDGELAWQVGAANGEGPLKNNTPGKGQDGLRTSARLVWMPLGAFTAAGPAFETVQDGGTRLALGAAAMRNRDSTGLATPAPGSDTSSLGLEAQLLSGPFSLLVEAFRRRSGVDGAPDVTDRGHSVQAGWLVVGEEWELVARDADVDYGAKDDAHENALGLNWYLDRHNLKWQLDWSRLRHAGATPDARRVRLQCQVAF
jgi:phosphate-selective porin